MLLNILQCTGQAPNAKPKVVWSKTSRTQRLRNPDLDDDLQASVCTVVSHALKMPQAGLQRTYSYIIKIS